VRLTLTQRLSLVFAVLLLVCCGISAWLQIRSNRMHEQIVVQGLSRGLAEHIASNTQLMNPGGLNSAAVRKLFGQLMVVNPSVEVYLLDSSGRITGYDAPADRLRRTRVDLAPIRRLLAGAPLPVLGDDPRSAHGTKVFSAAPLVVDGHPAGYIYVVLLGEARDQLAAQSATRAALNTALWLIGLVALLCLLAGLTAFALINRPLRRLTETVRRFDIEGSPASWPPLKQPDRAGDRDEIALLDNAFRQMAARVRDQWQTLTRQDQERRELIANISHDLRTPLASLHGYLETLSLKDATLDPAERRRYLGIALDQSRRVGALAQSLFELARLEYGFVDPEPEAFSLTDLVQDVFQKFELSAHARQVELRAAFTPPVPPVRADLGLIERVLTNLLENALSHTPQGGLVEVSLAPHEHVVDVTVSDTGAGIPDDLRADLFQKPISIGGARRGGGLGLRIVARILQLHDSRIGLVEMAGRGAAFRFFLPMAGGLAAAEPPPAPAIGNSL
jgi:signal transduction histidine kinase